MLGRAAFGDEAFDDGDDVIGGAGPPHVHGERLPGELIHDVAQLQPPAVRGLVELEVDGPHVVRSLGSQQRPTAGRPCSLALAGRRPAQPLVPPQAPGALAVDGVSLPTQDRVRRLPAPPGMPAGDLPQPPTHLLLLDRSRPGREPLRGAVLADDPAGVAFGDPEAIDEHDHRSPATLRGQKFPVMICWWCRPSSSDPQVS
jgi:hypothetical protein